MYVSESERERESMMRCRLVCSNIRVQDTRPTNARLCVCLCVLMLANFFLRDERTVSSVKK